MASILIESADPHSLQNLNECSEIAKRSNNNEMLATVGATAIATTKDSLRLLLYNLSRRECVKCRRLLTEGTIPDKYLAML